MTTQNPSCYTNQATTTMYYGFKISTMLIVILVPDTATGRINNYSCRVPNHLSSDTEGQLSFNLLGFPIFPSGMAAFSEALTN